MTRNDISYEIRPPAIETQQRIGNKAQKNNQVIQVTESVRQYVKQEIKEVDEVYRTFGKKCLSKSCACKLLY